MGGASLVKAAWLGLAYFGAAGAMFVFARFEGEVVCLWIATSILVAALVNRPYREWPLPLAASAIGCFIAIGQWGFGWTAAGPFALVNMAEAVIGASLFRRLNARDQAPFGSFAWFRRILLAVGVVAPLLAAMAAALAGHWLGHQMLQTFFSFLAGRSLGAMTLAPLCLLVASPEARRESLNAITGRGLPFILSIAGFTALCLLVFSVEKLPLTFLPILPLIFITLRLGREAAVLCMVILALVGGIANNAGYGPFQVIVADRALQILFLQFYLAATVLTILPVAAELDAR
jgi:integral membrane sensor domain MASE1